MSVKRKIVLYYCIMIHYINECVYLQQKNTSILENNKIKLLLGFILYFLVGCGTPDQVYLRGNIPLKDTFYIDVYNMHTGIKTFSDTICSENINHQIGTLPKGIYQLIVSWDRDIVKPQEIERFARQPELGTPRYYMSTTFWLDTKESNNYKLLLDNTYQQAELEELLLAKDGGESIKIAVVSDGKNNKIYNEYLALVDRYKAKNRYQKDSLQQVAIHYNDLKLLQEADRLQTLLTRNWLTNVKAELLKAEIDFMKNNIENEVIVDIYQIQANTKEDFKEYREVYHLFPPTIRQALACWKKNN